MDTTVTGTDGTYAHSNGVYVSAPSGFSGIAILTNTITTSAGRTYARSMYIPVLDIE